MLRVSLLVCCFLWSAIVLAQEIPPPPPPPPPTAEQAGEPCPTPHDSARSRVLGGHRFLPSDIVTDPFTDTYFSSVFGSGLIGGDGPGFQITMANGTYDIVKSGTVDLGLVAIDQTFAFQLGIIPQWAVRVSAGGHLLSASNGQTGLAVGVVVGYNASVGTTVSTQLGSSVRLGATVDLELTHAVSLDLASAILNSIRRGNFDTGSLVSETDALVLRPGLTAAFGLHEGVGLILDLEYAHRSVDTQRLLQLSASDSVSPGFSLSFDGNPLLSIPIGLGLSYEASIPFDGGTVWHWFVGGIYYTGRRDLVLGAEMVVKSAKFEPDISITNRNLQIVFRYQWN